MNKPCGNGGLNWDDVRPRIKAEFTALPDVEVRLFVPTVSEKRARAYSGGGEAGNDGWLCRDYQGDVGLSRDALRPEPDRGAEDDVFSRSRRPGSPRSRNNSTKRP